VVGAADRDLDQNEDLSIDDRIIARETAMAKSSFRRDPDPAKPEYPDLDRGRRTCLARLGAAAGAMLLALGGAAEAGELPGKKEKEKGKKKKKEQPKPPPARPGGPAYPPAQLDVREELLD
jgi:hypothetical protein